MREIRIKKPKAYDEIGASFTIAGSVSISWLKTKYGWYDNRLSLEFIDIEGQTFIGSSLMVVSVSWLTKLLGFTVFSMRYDFDQFNTSFLRQSQGRIIIKICGQNEREQFVFIPLRVPYFEPASGVDQAIVTRQIQMPEILKRYERELNEYNQEWGAIYESRKNKEREEGLSSEVYFSGKGLRVAQEIAKILEETDETFTEYLYSEEDERERALNEKYKEVLAWRGPLFRGLIAKFGEFEMRVHSNDHGKHFHVIHRGKRVNARFSFPELKLVNYTKQSRGTIGSKQETNIREFCLRPDVFKIIEEQFAKRG